MLETRFIFVVKDLTVHVMFILKYLCYLPVIDPDRIGVYIITLMLCLPVIISMIFC
jgi:hypothetical protein